MRLIVNAHKIELIPEEPVNEKEINISKCKFEFSDEYGDNLVKEAYFTLDGNTYKQIIVNDECSYPPEVLVKEATIELGVVAYEVQDEEYIERFNPSPVYFQTQVGSLKDYAENSQEITPSELEQYEQALEEGLAQAQNVDIDASKTGSTATITITNRLGEEKSVQISDGAQGPKGQDGADGITPNIQVGTTTTLPAGSNATVSQRGTTENPIFDFGIPKGEDGQSGGVSDYTELSNKPKINNVELNGNKTSSDLGIITKDVEDLIYYYTKNEVDSKVSSVYRYRDTVSTYGNLPSTNLVVGDVYNIETADSEHGIQAGDNVAWNGTTWDKLSGNVDLSGYQPLLVSGTNIKTINNESILGSGNVDITAKWYIAGDFLIYNVTPGNYNIVPNNTTLITNTGLPTTEISEALTLANTNNKKLTLSIYSYKAKNFVIYYTSNVPQTGAGKTLTMGTRTINNDGNIWDSTLNINYGIDFVINSLTCTGIYQYGIGTANSNAYTPGTNSYQPATAKYAEKMVESVAPAYSSSSTYDIGDFVSYQGKLYKCSTAIATAETWNSSHWTETTATDEMGGGGSSTPKYYIDGAYLIYNLAPGLYKLTSGSTSWSTTTNLSNTELSEALQLAYDNDKYLVLNIPTTQNVQTITCITGNKVSTGIGLVLSASGIVISNPGSICAIILNITYTNSNDIITVSGTSVRSNYLFALGTANTTAFTPTGDYHPATKKYVDDLVGDVETILTALISGNGV